MAHSADSGVIIHQKQPALPDFPLDILLVIHDAIYRRREQALSWFRLRRCTCRKFGLMPGKAVRIAGRGVRGVGTTLAEEVRE